MKARPFAVGAFVLVLLVPVAGVVGSCLAQAKDVDLGTVDGRLRPCPSSPNCVCSEYEGEHATIAPLAFSGDPDAAFRSLVELLEQEPRVEIVTVGSDYVHAIFRSPLFRFPDDVEFRLDPAASVVHVRSASRIGYSDLGANRRRIESIRERWLPLR